LDSRKEYITEQFGLKKVAILENWLHAISNLRNCCAHHSRTWNRRFMVKRDIAIQHSLSVHG